MKRNPLARALAISAAAFSLLAPLATPVQAAPTALDMNSLAWNLSSGQQSQGFGLSSQGGFAFVGNAGNCAPLCAHNGSNYVWSGNAVINLQAVDGSSFSLTQFDGAETHTGQPVLWANAIEVVGQYASGGSVSAQFVLDAVNDGLGPLADFQSFYLPSTFTGLSSVSFQVAGARYGQFALDNVVLNGSFQTLSGVAAVNGVPEPGSLSLAIAALLLAAATLRARHRALNARPARVRRSP